MGNLNRTFITDRFDAKIKDKQGIFDCRRTDSNTFYRSFGVEMGSNRRTKMVRKTNKESK
jgi:hypothetical protein